MSMEEIEKQSFSRCTLYTLKRNPQATPHKLDYEHYVSIAKILPFPYLA